MDLGQAWRTIPLGTADRHAEALTLAATRLLRAGRPADAFELIDRRCRIEKKPRAADLAIRALASRLCGRAEEADDDLARAESADPLDPFVASTRLRLAVGEVAAMQAARRIAEIPQGTPDTLRPALERLVGIGKRAVARIDLLDGRLTGFAAWPAGRPVVLAVRGPDGERSAPLAADRSLPFAGPGVDACLIDLTPGFAVDGYRLRENGAILAEGRLWPRSAAALSPGFARPPRSIPARAALTVIVPVYADLDATRECLMALVAEAGGRQDVRLVVVDDASPDEDVRALLDALAGRGAIELKRNVVNLGFAGAVRRGLEDARGCDVLLLNADAVLPPGALDRLAQAAYAAPDIGTATPLSNNGEYTSFPRHAEAHPAPPRDAARRIDEAAARLHAGRVVDLPNGTGFCLFIRHDCLAAVGGMPAIYLRGYFEDLEFCLRARRAGFRNVCAASLYVVHHGTLSFRADKRALVVRNLALLRRRFPDLEAECAAYARADPLRGVRAAIEKAVGASPEASAPTVAAELERAPPAAGPARPPTLGVLMAMPSPEGDDFVCRLSAALRARRAEARIVVLGRALDDLALMGRGNVFVTGPVEAADYRRIAARYGLSALASPSFCSPPALFDRMARETNLPAAPFGRFPDARPGDAPALPVDPSAHARDNASAIVDWFAGCLPT